MAILEGVRTQGSAPNLPKRVGRIALLLMLPGTAYLAAFFVAPFVQLIVTSLQAPAAAGGIGQYVLGLEFRNYWGALEQYWPHLLRSSVYAILATTLALVISYPIAYLIGITVRGRPILQGALLITVVAPFFISMLLRTLAWKSLLPSDWVGTDFSVVLGLVYNFIPFMVLPIFAVLQALDIRLLEASEDLYAMPLATFRRVTLPLSLPGVVSGTLLTFIPISGDYVVASREFLGATSTAMMGNAIEANFLQSQNYPIAAALSVTLMGLVLVAVGLYIRRVGAEELL